MAKFKIVSIVKEIYYCEAESQEDAELLFNNDFLELDSSQELDTQYTNIWISLVDNQ